MKVVTKEQYYKVYESYEKLEVFSSFSDPEGTFPIGYGCPAMDTTWGINDKEVCRCEQRKDSRHDKEWQCTYYLF